MDNFASIQVAPRNVKQLISENIPKESCDDNHFVIPFYCYLCHKNCVTPVVYTRHLQNPRHIRMLQNSSLRNSPPTSPDKADNFKTSSTCYLPRHKIAGDGDASSMLMSQVETSGSHAVPQTIYAKDCMWKTGASDHGKSDITDKFVSRVPPSDSHLAKSHTQLSPNHRIPLTVESNVVLPVQELNDAHLSSSSIAAAPVKESVNDNTMKEAVAMQLENISCVYCGIKVFENISQVKDHFSSALHRIKKKEALQENSGCLEFTNDLKNVEPTNITDKNNIDSKQHIEGISCTPCGITSFNSIKEIKSHFSSYSHWCKKKNSLKLTELHCEPNSSINLSKGIGASCTTLLNEEEKPKVSYVQQLEEVKCNLCGIKSFNNINDIKEHYASENHRRKMCNSTKDSLYHATSSPVHSALSDIPMDEEPTNEQASGFYLECDKSKLPNSFSLSKDSKLQEVSSKDVLHPPSTALQTYSPLQNDLDINLMVNKLQQQKSYEVVKSAFKIIDSDKPFAYE